MSAEWAKLLQLEFAGEKVRVRVGAIPLTSAATDADGWVTYIATNVLSSRVAVPLDATRFWFTLAGGDVPGRGELVLSDKPETITRFTWDGSPVTETSTPVDGPLTLTFDALIRSRVYGAALYRSTETVAAFTSAIPQLPAESYVSPAYITITYATLDSTPAQVSLDGPSGNMPGLSIGDFQHLMRYPLAPFEPTPLTLHRNNVADLSGNVTWRALEIGNAPDMQIHQGESLLLTAGMLGETGTLQIVVLDSSNQVFSACTGIPGETFPVLFDRGGLFNAVATLNGVSIGSLLVSVAHVDLQGPIACQIGYLREKEVLIYGPTNDIFFTSSDSKTMTVTNNVQTARGRCLYLKALKAGKPMLQARLGSPTGPIIAQQVVDVFSMSVSGGDIIDMDTSETVFHLVMTPYVPGLDFNTSMFSHHSTFADGTITYEFHSSDFTVFTNGTNGVSGSYDLTVYVPKNEKSSCFSLTTSQALKKIGYLQANRSGCWFKVPIKYALIGQYVTMHLELAAGNYRNHPPLGSHGPHALEIRKSDNPSISISVTPNSASCSDYAFELPIAFTANDKTGWYDLLIDGTPFKKRICILKVEIRNYDETEPHVKLSIYSSHQYNAVVTPKSEEDNGVFVWSMTPSTLAELDPVNTRIVGMLAKENEGAFTLKVIFQHNADVLPCADSKAVTIVKPTGEHTVSKNYVTKFNLPGDGRWGKFRMQIEPTDVNYAATRVKEIFTDLVYQNCNLPGEPPYTLDWGGGLGWQVSETGEYGDDYVGFYEDYFNRRLRSGVTGDFEWSGIQHMRIGSVFSVVSSKEYTTHVTSAHMYAPPYQLKATRREQFVEFPPTLPEP